MKAVIHSQYGNPEVLKLTTLERPVPQKNEVQGRRHPGSIDVYCREKTCSELSIRLGNNG
jgi:hypothetical protein